MWVTKFKEHIDTACNQIKNGQSSDMFPIPLGMVTRNMHDDFTTDD